MTDVDRGLVRDLVRAETLSAVDRAMLEAMAAHLPADGGAVGRETEGALTVVDSFGQSPIEQNRRVMQPAHEVYAAGQPWRVDDLTDTRSAAAATSDSPAAGDGVFRSFLGVPVGEQGVVFTVATAQGVFTAGDVQWVSDLAAIATAALERIHDSNPGAAGSGERPDAEGLVGAVAHDLRNSFTVADGYLDLARNECDTKELEEVATALDRMEPLVDDLFRLSQVDEDSLELSCLDLSGLVMDCWQHVETGDARVSCEVDRSIRADPDQVKRLVENLFRNAVEHNDEAVEVTVGTLDGGFFIADDGTGIPADQRDRVFEATYSTAPDGTGLGLSIVKRITDAHGWEIRVTDGRDGGARFELTGVDIVEE